MFANDFSHHWRSFLITWFGIIGLSIGLDCFAGSQVTYLDASALQRKVEQLARDHAPLVQVKSLTKSRSGDDVWQLTLSAGRPEEERQRPALLAIAGLEGNDLFGPSSLIYWAESLLSSSRTNAALRELLASQTIYLVPCANPEGARRFFSIPQWEAATNLTPNDDDHDGLVDEDGPDDLDGDGRISSMRVEDPEGEYLEDPLDLRLMVKADRAKGEKGRWNIFSEGIDNDRDERWNEDALGGVNANRNFSYEYRFFAADSGVHQICEPETQALADFVVDHPAIGLVFSFGSPDNLAQSPKAEPTGAESKPRKAIQEDDAPFYRELGKGWRDALNLSKELSAVSEPGSFADWIYFHRGRLSLAAKPWSPAMQLALKPATEAVEKKGDRKEEKKEEKKEAPPQEAEGGKPPPPDGSKEKSKDSDKRNEDDRAYLKWLESNSSDSFKAWTPFEHPDFPGKKVEIGGWAPYARVSPPVQQLADWAERHAAFLTSLVAKLPRLELSDIRSKSLGENVFDVSVRIRNSGYLPLRMKQGGVSREVNPTRARLKIAPDQILSGPRQALIDNIPGSGGTEELRWIVLAPASKQIEFEAISMLGGTVRTNIILEGGSK